MVRIGANERQTIWLGDSLKRLRAFDDEVQDALGYNLGEIQRGDFPQDSEPMPEFGGGVLAIKDDFQTDTYRLMCVICLKKGVYVLHTFKKKSNSGRKTPRKDAKIIKKRLLLAQQEDAK